MLTLNVNEIFYSLQGEGIRAGKASIFIRLQGCNLTCGFCDTEFTSGKSMTVEEILNHINKYPCKEIVWTGGEPALQLNNEIVNYFKNEGYYNCIETNGSMKVPSNLDFITLSPKVAEHILEKNFKKVNEIKYVRHKGHTSLPQTKILADYYFISPEFNGDNYDLENIKHCINLIKENPKWQLTLQIHKLLKIH